LGGHLLGVLVIGFPEFHRARTRPDLTPFRLQEESVRESRLPTGHPPGAADDREPARVVFSRVENPGFVDPKSAPDRRKRFSHREEPVYPRGITPVPRDDEYPAACPAFFLTIIVECGGLPGDCSFPGEFLSENILQSRCSDLLEFIPHALERFAD
jgi:hypothetical protein